MNLVKLKQPSFILSVVCSLKLILQVFNVNIPDDTLNAFADGICALMTIIGIFMDHMPAAPAAQKPPDNTANEKQLIPNNVAANGNLDAADSKPSNMAASIKTTTAATGNSQDHTSAPV